MIPPLGLLSNSLHTLLSSLVLSMLDLLSFWDSNSIFRNIFHFGIFSLNHLFYLDFLFFFSSEKKEFQYAQPFLTALFFGFFYALVTRWFYVLVIVWDMITRTPNTQSHILNALSPSQEFSRVGLTIWILTSFLLSAIIFFFLFFRRQLWLTPPTQ